MVDGGKLYIFVTKNKNPERKSSLPRYQNIVPSSCGPWLTIHVSVTILPILTYKSLGPIMLAFASVLTYNTNNINDNGAVGS